MARAPKEPAKLREVGTVCYRFPENAVEMFWHGEVHRPDAEGCVWLPKCDDLVSHGFTLMEGANG